MIIYTIGVYGFDNVTFFSALLNANVTTLVDIRRRRGVRGPMYRFANAKALEQAATSHGIGYVAEQRLSPTSEMRAMQKAIDERHGISKRSRNVLADEFVSSYNEQVLRRLPEAYLGSLLARLGERPCLLCVERNPSACHRSLAASWISQRTGAPVVDLGI